METLLALSLVSDGTARERLPAARLAPEPALVAERFKAMLVCLRLGGSLDLHLAIPFPRLFAHFLKRDWSLQTDPLFHTLNTPF